MFSIMDVAKTAGIGSGKCEYTLVNAIEPPDTSKSMTNDISSPPRDVQVHDQHKPSPNCSPLPYPPITPASPHKKSILIAGPTLGLLPESLDLSKTPSYSTSTISPWQPNNGNHKSTVIKKHSDNYPPSHGYGTFGGRKSIRSTNKKKLRVSFDDREGKLEEMANHDRISKCSKKILPENLSAELSDESNEFLATYSEDNMTHVLADNRAIILTMPTRVHFRPETVTSMICCPLCGLLANIYFLRSCCYARRGNHAYSRRMMEHSNFCVRLAIIFGTVVWFIIFLLLLMFGTG